MKFMLAAVGHTHGTHKRATLVLHICRLRLKPQFVCNFIAVIITRNLSLED